MLEGAHSQQRESESQIREEFRALEKKYHKAKKLIKEFQSRFVASSCGCTELFCFEAWKT